MFFKTIGIFSELIFRNEFMRELGMNKTVKALHLISNELILLYV
jgi:hypothetical protein